MEILSNLFKIIFIIVLMLVFIIVVLLIRKNFINTNKENDTQEVNVPRLEDGRNSIYKRKVTELDSKLQTYHHKIVEQKEENEKLSDRLKKLEKEKDNLYSLIKESINIQKTILVKSENIDSLFIDYYLKTKVNNFSLSLFILSISLKPNYENINLLKEIDNVITTANSQYKAEDFINEIYNLGKLIINYIKDVLEIDNEQEVASILLEISNIIKNSCYSINLYVPKPKYAYFDINTMETDNLKQGQLINKVITWGVTIDSIEYKPFVS